MLETPTTNVIQTVKPKRPALEIICRALIFRAQQRTVNIRR